MASAPVRGRACGITTGGRTHRSAPTGETRLTRRELPQGQVATCPCGGIRPGRVWPSFHLDPPCSRRGGPLWPPASDMFIPVPTFRKDRHGGLSLRRTGPHAVIPAKAGIHFRLCLFAFSFGCLCSRAGRIGIEHKNERRILWIPHPDAAQKQGRGRPPGEKSKWIPGNPSLLGRH